MRAVERALDGERPPDELIVVDDGSTDDTAERIAGLGQGVRYIRQENAGAAAARNRGVQAAKHPWIAFLDSDDTWSQAHLRRAAEAIDATDGVADLYFADTRRTDAEGGSSQWAAAGFSPRSPFEIASDAMAWALLARQPMMLQSSVIRRESLIALGGLDGALVVREDTDLFLRMCMRGVVCAFAGGGAIMGDDDRSGRRLTATFTTRDEAYWSCSARMYRRARSDSRASMTPGQRREVGRRLAVAYRRLGRIALVRRQPVGALAWLARCAVTDPRVLIRPPTLRR